MSKSIAHPNIDDRYECVSEVVAYRLDYTYFQPVRRETLDKFIISRKIQLGMKALQKRESSRSLLLGLRFLKERRNSRFGTHNLRSYPEYLCLKLVGPEKKNLRQPDSDSQTLDLDCRLDSLYDSLNR